MRTLLYVILAVVVSGCAYSSSHKVRLDEAQRLIAESPKEAFERLNAMDVSEFDDSATMARWAVLYSESMLANRFHAPSDSIINMAVDYYSNHDITQLPHLQQLKAKLAVASEEDALVTALYFQKEKELRLYEAKLSRERYLWIGLFILLIAGGVIVWQRQRLKLQSADNDRLVAEASNLKNLLADKDNDIQMTLNSMLESRFALIDSLCQTYYESQGTKNERKAIAEKVKAEIEGVRSDSFAEMELWVNSCRQNILERLRQCLPDITPSDYQLAVYMACGLSSRSISLLLGETIEVIYKRKSRLKSRLRKCEASGSLAIA